MTWDPIFTINIWSTEILEWKDSQFWLCWPWIPEGLFCEENYYTWNHYFDLKSEGGTLATICSKAPFLISRQSLLCWASGLSRAAYRNVRPVSCSSDFPFPSLRSSCFSAFYRWHVTCSTLRRRRARIMSQGIVGTHVQHAHTHDGHVRVHAHTCRYARDPFLHVKKIDFFDPIVLL